MQKLLWIGMALDLILFLPALYVVGEAFAAAGMGGRSYQTGVSVLAVCALPVLCILAPGLAWKRFNRASPCSALLVVLTPFVYVALLATSMYFL
jgi:hypothetical protein